MEDIHYFEVINIPKSDYLEGYVLEAYKRKKQMTEGITMYIWTKEKGKNICTLIAQDKIKELLKNKNIKPYEEDGRKAKLQIFNS